MLTIVNEGSSLTIVNEGSSLTIVNERSSLTIFNEGLSKKITCNFIECRFTWSLTVVGELKLLDIFLKTTQW